MRIYAVAGIHGNIGNIDEIKAVISQQAPGIKIKKL